MPNIRVGGWIMSIEDMFVWAAKFIPHKCFYEIECDEAFQMVTLLAARLKLGITYVTYPAGMPKVMIVTQYGEVKDWREGYDPRRLPQFKVGRKDERIREILEKDGFEELVFVTSFGPMP
ncbi:hypothetical protein Hypma_012240 [Hypsizygus marmoreus]|uniref:Uncharacterized protein n=1 Tax=Hypsizygus marmoreus TaxID=39966 RepID=A0A369JJJ5_HYPMA|nr:hypothetical protein Hypma_012240 [Hypsizygus marmoreus]